MYKKYQKICFSGTYLLNRNLCIGKTNSVPKLWSDKLWLDNLRSNDMAYKYILLQRSFETHDWISLSQENGFDIDQVNSSR